MSLNIDGLKKYLLQKIQGPSSCIYKISHLGLPNHKNFQEIYCSSLYGCKIRGWYKHDNSSQNLSVIKGSVKFVIYDDRALSVTKGNIAEVILSSKDFSGLHMPPGVWYAFKEKTGDESYIMNCLPLRYDLIQSQTLPIDSNLIPYGWVDDK